VTSATILGGASWRTGGESVAVLLWHDNGAVFAYLGVRVVCAAGPAAPEAAVGATEAREVRVMRRRTRARGRGLERGRQLGKAASQLHGGRLVQAIVTVGGRGCLFGGRRHARVAGAAWRGRGLGADNRRWTVDLAEVCERDLFRRALAMASGGAHGHAAHRAGSTPAVPRKPRSLTVAGWEACAQGLP
jgi:hypothetical protein